VKKIIQCILLEFLEVVYDRSIRRIECALSCFGFLRLLEMKIIVCSLVFINNPARKYLGFCVGLLLFPTTIHKNA